MSRNYSPLTLSSEIAALAVYINLLSMIEAMLSTLLDKKFLARIKDGLKGPLADRTIDEKRRLFNASVSDLEEQVQYLHLQSSQRAHGLIERMAPQLQRTETLATQSYILTSSIGEDVRDIGGQMEDMNEKVSNDGIPSLGSTLFSRYHRDRTHAPANPLIRSTVPNVEYEQTA